MGPKGVALLSITFVAGAAAGALMFGSSEEMSSSPSQGSDLSLYEIPLKIEDDREEEAARGTPSSTGASSTGASSTGASSVEPVIATQEFQGRSAGEILRELERAYQELALRRVELMEEREEAQGYDVEFNPNEGGADEGAVNDIDDSRESGNARYVERLNGSAELESREGERVEFSHLEVDSMAENSDEAWTGALAPPGPDVVNVHNGDSYARAETHQTLIVNRYSPVYFFSAEASARNSSGERLPQASSTTFGGQVRFRGGVSRNDPWAPIDYSKHHNPFSSTPSGRGMSTSSSAFVFRARSR